MEGPTPVSALIHAATMVVAGVYLVARMFTIYSFGAPDALAVVAFIGAFSSLFAAIISLETSTEQMIIISLSIEPPCSLSSILESCHDKGRHSFHSAFQIA